MFAFSSFKWRIKNLWESGNEKITNRQKRKKKIHHQRPIKLQAHIDRYQSPHSSITEAQVLKLQQDMTTSN